MWDNKLVKELVTKEDTVLDLGCWDAFTWRDIEVKKRVSLDICDTFPTNLPQKPLEVHPNIVWDLRNFPYPFASCSYDIVTSFGSIEHIPKEAGKEMILEMLRIASKRVIIQTPKEFRDNLVNAEYNTHNEHVSLWGVEDFSGWTFLEHSDETQIFCYKDL